MALTGYVAATTATFLARHHWLADLVTHLRPHLLVVAGLLAALLAAARRGRWIPPLAAAAAVHGAVLLWPTAGPDTTAAGPALRLTTFNLLRGNTAYGRTLAHVRDRRPDVLVLQEASGAWVARLAGLADRLPYTTGRPRGGTDTVVMSRFPIRSAAVERPASPGGRRPAHAALRVELLVGGGRAVLWAVHPPRPTGAAPWRARNDHLGWVADRVGAEDPRLPVLVAGDLNQTPWTPWHREFLRRGGLVDAAGTGWPGPTWRPFGPPAGRLLGVPIDRILVRPGTAVTGFGVGPGLGSDHLPVTADLALGRP